MPLPSLVHALGGLEGRLTEPWPTWMPPMAAGTLRLPPTLVRGTWMTRTVTPVTVEDPREVEDELPARTVTLRNIVGTWCTERCRSPVERA